MTEDQWDNELDASNEHYLLTIWPPRDSDSKFLGHTWGFSLNCPSMERAEEILQELRYNGCRWEAQIDSN